MSRDNAHTVALPAPATDHMPAQAAEHLPPNVPTGPEIHHEAWNPAEVQLAFDADTFDFHAWNDATDEFLVGPFTDPTSDPGSDVAFFNEFHASRFDPNDGFGSAPPYSGTAMLSENDPTAEIIYHTDFGADVHMTHYNFDDATGIASFDWWVV